MISNAEVLNSIGLAVHFEYRQFLHVAKAAIKEIFHEPADVFWTGPVKNLLFDGIEIDCDTDVPLAKLTCNQMRKIKNPAIRPSDGKKLKFSLLGGVKNEIYFRHSKPYGVFTHVIFFNFLHL